MTDATDLLKPGERLDYLAREKLSIIQNPDYFAFSVDAILRKPSNKSVNGLLMVVIQAKTSVFTISIPKNLSIISLAPQTQFHFG